MSFLVAAVQFTAGRRWAEHAGRVWALVEDAARQGARLIATPENTDGMNPDHAQLVAEGVREAEQPTVRDFSDWARALKVWLLCGSVQVRSGAVADRLVNRSLLFAPDGSVAGRYDKIHLFEADLPNGEAYRESAFIAPGANAVLAPVGEFRLGLSICYDLRFPALYRKLAQAGADVLAVPSAFVVPTGQAHWEVLVRARAIETGCYVLAPGQTGTHAGGRQTYGHSLIVDPWGKVLAAAGEGEEVILAPVEKDQVRAARRALPDVLTDRAFGLPAQSA